jgi:hypothetical protein
VENKNRVLASKKILIYQRLWTPEPTYRIFPSDRRKNSSSRIAIDLVEAKKRLAKASAFCI